MVKSRFRNFARRTLASILVPIMVAVGTPKVQAASKESINLISTELSYTRDNNIVKFRPFVFSSPDNQRTDLMLGKKFDDFTLYGYFKSDNKDRSWMGVRADKGFNLGGKIDGNLQLRYFFGLTEESLNHFYFIPNADYKVNDKLKVGFLGYAKKDEGKEPFFYLGPSAGFKFTDKLSTTVSYDFDLFGNYGNLLFLSFNYNF